MKIKLNKDNQTINIKGMTPLEFSALVRLAEHVRLGDSSDASEAVFNFLEAENAFRSTDVGDAFPFIPVTVHATMEHDDDNPRADVTIYEPMFVVDTDPEDWS